MVSSVRESPHGYPLLLYATQIPYTQGFEIPKSYIGFFSLSITPSPNAVAAGMLMISRFILMIELQMLRVDCLVLCVCATENGSTNVKEKVID